MSINLKADEFRLKIQPQCMGMKKTGYENEQVRNVRIPFKIINTFLKNNVCIL